MQYTYNKKSGATGAQKYWGKGRGKSSITKTKTGRYKLRISPKNPKFYRCSQCGRFVKIIAGGPYIDDFGYWVTYECKKCGVQHD